MAASLMSVGSLVSLLCLFVCVNSIKDGTTVSQCDYPGVVAILLPSNDAIVCNGIRQGGIIYVPELCGQGMESMLSSNDLKLVYGDGTQNVTIHAGTTGTYSNGLYEISVPGATTVDCNVDAVLYDQNTMELDLGTCEIVGYGGSTTSSYIYDGNLQAAVLTKSTSAPCCQVIYDSLTSSEKGSVTDNTVPLNCVTSDGAGCAMGDLGAPVYCQTTTAQTVVVGLAASTPCVSGGTFLLHDLTNSDENFKFGITV